MIKKILAFLGISSEDVDSSFSSRRKYVRHAAFNAEVIIGDDVYQAHDWSMGGVAFNTGADDGKTGIGDKVRVSLSFHFPDNIITIGQDAHIARSTGGTTAVEFDPLPKSAQIEFNKVLESLYTQSFIESQVAG